MIHISKFLGNQYNIYEILCRFEEFESKNWLFNQVISDCRVYSANILLPNDMHNPLTSAPTKERKGAKFLKKLKPYSQLFIDIIILFPILFCNIYIYI